MPTDLFVPVRRYLDHAERDVMYALRHAAKADLRDAAYEDLEKVHAELRRLRMFVTPR